MTTSRFGNGGVSKVSELDAHGLTEFYARFPEQRHILATQDDYASMFRALGSIRLKARELYSSLRRLLVVAREQHNEMASCISSLKFAVSGIS
jgi:hypothetical protein